MRVYRHKQKAKDGTYKPTAKFYIEFRDHRGRLRSLPAFREKRVTQEFGALVSQLVSVRASGASLDSGLQDRVNRMSPELVQRLIKLDLLDANQGERLKPLSEHVADYFQALKDRNRTARYIQQTETRLERILNHCKCSAVHQLTAGTVQRALAHFCNVGMMSAQTVNHHFVALNQFVRWMHGQGRSPSVNLGGVTKLNVQADRRRVRRALNSNEFKALLAAAKSGPVRHRMTGQARYLLYLVAATTGLRSSELASLKVCDLQGNGDAWTIRAFARNTKNGRDARQPIPTAVARDLLAHLAGRHRDEPMFCMPKAWHTAKMLKADLEAAGVPYVDQDGQVADFHSLRHQFITDLVRSGANPKVAQLLARHSTPTLTLGRYSHAEAGELHDAVENLGYGSDDHAHESNEVVGSIDGANSDSGPESLPGSLLFKRGKTRTLASKDEHSASPEGTCAVVLEAASVAEKRPVKLAEEEGFEPPLPEGKAVFKTAAINHSATPPLVQG